MYGCVSVCEMKITGVKKFGELNGRGSCSMNDICIHLYIYHLFSLFDTLFSLVFY